MKKGALPELLLPAGSPETFCVACDYGADAVYLGLTDLGLRSKAKNFTEDELAAAVRMAHERGIRVYLTANIFPHPADMERAAEILSGLPEPHPDALIVSDPGLFSMAQRLLPDVQLHISTQANNTNAETYRFWHGLGASRVVAARELSLAELAQIRRDVPPELEIEVFVHGAMCMAYSGRCVLSSFLTGRDGNRGSCTQPCRWSYSLVEETRPGEAFPVREDGGGSYILNSRDLCMIGHLPELLDAGMDSLKVEGRMKSGLYVAAVGSAYRRALRDLSEDPERYRENVPVYLDLVSRCPTRQFTTGFFFGQPFDAAQRYDSSGAESGYIYLGAAEDGTSGGRFPLRQKNKFSVGDGVEILNFDGTVTDAVVTEIRDADGRCVRSAPHAGQALEVSLDVPVEKGQVLRRRKKPGEPLT